MNQFKLQTTQTKPTSENTDSDQNIRIHKRISETNNNPFVKEKRNLRETEKAANFFFFFFQFGGELGFKDWIFLPLGQSLGLLRMRLRRGDFFFAPDRSREEEERNE